MLRLNFSETEIEVFCSKYDVDGNFEFTTNDIKAIEEGANEDEDLTKIKEPEETKGPPEFNKFMFDG